MHFILFDLYSFRQIKNVYIQQVAKRSVETALNYSKDIIIGNGRQGPFDHLLKLKSNAKNLIRVHPFDPSDLFLYAVTDSRMNKKWGHSITDAVKAAIEGGASIIQLRLVVMLCTTSPLYIFIHLGASYGI